MSKLSGLIAWSVSAVRLSGLEAVFASTVLFQTGFEKTEGYDPEFTLSGQRGWLSEGSGGNGLVEAFSDYGQQGYVGFLGSTNADGFLNLFEPVDYHPVPGNPAVIKFSVLMEIVPSTNGQDDDFRWSFYNAESSPLRLFSIDFEGRNQDTGVIALILDNGQAIDTGYVFGYDGSYLLDVWIDFSRGFWSAALNDIRIANSQPLTTQGAELSLGDIDAVWLLHDTNRAGDNYMVFDNYIISAEDENSISAALEPIGVDTNHFFELNILGEEGLNYSVEVTTDFHAWFSLGTFTAPAGGVFTFEDTTSNGFPSGFYRVRQVD